MSGRRTVTDKAFSWSYSRLKAYEDCPNRYYQLQIAKSVVEEQTELLQWGDDVHKAMAKALRTKTLLPTTFRIYQPWIEKVLNMDGELLVEDQCRWAITKYFTPTTWFSKTVWLRAIADVVRLQDDVAWVGDWKAGKSQNGDPVQLVLTSLMMFAQFPELKAVRSDFIWLQEDHQTTQVVYREEIPDLWAEIMPRVKKLEAASLASKFPPNPGRFCRSWCPVKSCEYHGK